MNQKKRSGLTRIAALLLVLLLAVNLVVPCLAADTDYPILYWDDTKTFDTGILNYDYDKIPDYMLDSMFMRALEFTGYDVQFLKDNKLLFHPDYIGGNLAANQSSLREDPILSGIGYNDSGKWGGLTKTATTEKELATTVTGMVPDIPAHLENGMSCTSFVDYFYLAYLPNCEGVDVSAIQSMRTIAGNRYTNGTYTYPDMWTEMCEGKGGLIEQGIVTHFEIELEASKEQTEEYNAIWRQIHPGTIVRFGDEYSPYIHYAIFIGIYNNLHYMIHVGNDRGPEIIVAEAMGSDASAKRSYPIDFYDPKLTEKYGSIQVVKTDADNDTQLAGAVFSVVNQVTKEEYLLGPTNDKGYAIRDSLPYTEGGTKYIVKEVVAPTGYSVNPTEFEVIVSDDTPLVTLEITNDREYGALQILKNTNTGDNKAGWLFNVYKNTPTWSNTLTVNNSGQMYRVTVHDKDGNSVTSETASMTQNPFMILQQPENMMGELGEIVAFSVLAQGEGLTYQWQYRYKGTTTWINSAGSTSRSFTVEMLARRDTQGARCIITDKYGNSVITDEVMMVLPTTLAVTWQPKDTTAVLGQTVSFSTNASGNNLSYQWQYSADGGNTWANCSASNHDGCYGTTGVTVFYTAKAEYMDRIYRCKISDGTNTVYTKTAKANFVPTIINEQPQNQIVNMGSETVFRIDATGAGLTYTWQGSTDNGNTWTDLSVSHSYYTKLTEENDGMRIRCVISRDGMSVVSESAVLAAPDTLAILSQPKDITGPAGTYATFAVDVQGEELTYFWETSTDGGNTWTMLTTPINDTPYETGADGKCLISSIQTGNYFVVEVDDGKENWEYDLAPKLVTVTASHTVSAPAIVNFTNNKLIGNLAIEKITEDGLNVDGWKFSIYADEACTILLAGPEYTSGGRVIFNDLPIGIVWIKELGNANEDIGDMYYASENPMQVEVLPGQTVNIQFENKVKYGSLEIQKETNTGDRKDGWKIHVRYNNGGKYVEIGDSPFTTDSTGYLLIENLLPGEYVVYEEDNGSDYWICDVTPQKVTVAAGQNTGPVTIHNTAYGKLTIKKATTDNSSVQGYQFNIYDPDGNLVTGSPFQTDSNGYIDVGYVLPGMYTVEEVLADDDAYEIVGDSRQTLEIKAETETVFSFVNAPKVGTLVIQKQTNTGSDLGGWKVNVYDPNGNLLAGSPFTTDDVDGKLTISNLPIGVYTVVEIDDGKEMWVYDLEEKTVTVPHNGTGTVTITNTQLGGGLISKNTTNGGTKAGWQFKVWTDSADFGVFTTDANGNIDLGLLYPGTYYVQEIGHVSMSAEELSYWTLDNQVKELVVVAGTTNTVTVTNEWFGCGKIVKTTNGGTKEGWQFKVWTDTADIGTFTTTANGEIALGKLTPGTYYVQEIGHATMTADQLAFWRMDTEIKTVEIVAGETSSVTINNVQYGMVNLTKKTTDSSSVENWRFDITDSNGNTTTYYTDAQGKISLMLLPGTYTITEVIPAEVMYEPQNGADCTVEIVAGEIQVVSYVNDPILGHLNINKTDGKGNPVSHAGFVAVDTKGNRYSFIESDTTPGLYVLSDIPIDTYIITEEVVPPGFQISGDNSWTVSLSKDHRSETLNITNTPLVKGQIVKEMSDGSSAAGWIFDIYRVSDNAFIGTFTTGTDGTITTDFLLPGEYRVIERVPEDSIYHPVGGAEKTLTVVAGETTSVKFVNALRAGEITVNKVDGSNDAALAGAKFLLEWLDNDVWTPVIYSDTIIPGGCSSVGLENGCLTSDENGKVSFYGLHPDYQYRLTEIDAPDGYILQAGTIFEGTLPVDTLSSEHTVYNHPNFVLPSTGVDNNFRWLEIFTLCLLAAFALAVGYALNTIRVTRGKNRK